LRLPLLGGRREEPLPSRHLTLLSQCDRNSYPENHLSDIGRWFPVTAVAALVATQPPLMLLPSFIAVCFSLTWPIRFLAWAATVAASPWKCVRHKNTI
jgi:hypothetical protein